MQSCREKAICLMVTRIFLTLPMILLSFTAWTENKESSGVKKTDTAYIADYTNLLTGRLYLLFQNSGLAILPGTEDEVVFRPNVFIRTGIAGFYKWFGLGLSINNPFYKFSSEKYGSTSTIDLRVNAFGKSTIVEGYLQNFRGFYTGNLRDSAGNYYQSPGMTLFSIGAHFYWIYNSSRFSIRAAFIQNERQKKSAGSLMMKVSLFYYKIGSENTIYPPEVIQILGIKDHQLISGGNFYGLGLAPGYSYSLVFLKNFYFNAAAFPGFQWQYYTYQTKTMTRNNTEFSLELSFRLATGYNSDRWFIGAGLIVGNNESQLMPEKPAFYYGLTQIRIWGGTRFNWFSKKKK